MSPLPTRTASRSSIAIRPAVRWHRRRGRRAACLTRARPAPVSAASHSRTPRTRFRARTARASTQCRTSSTLSRSSTALARPRRVPTRSPPRCRACRCRASASASAARERRSPPASARRRLAGLASASRCPRKPPCASSVQRALRGRKVGKRCQAPSRKNRKRRSCTRFKSAGTLTRNNRNAGKNTVAFSGRVGKRKLKPSRYRATIRATDLAGNRSKSRRVTFTVVRR